MGRERSAQSAETSELAAGGCFLLLLLVCTSPAVLPAFDPLMVHSLNRCRLAHLRPPKRRRYCEEEAAGAALRGAPTAASLLPCTRVRLPCIAAARAAQGSSRPAIAPPYLQRSPVS